MRYTRQTSIAILALAMLALSACNANSIISKAINRHASGSGFSLTGQRAHIMSQAKDAGALDSSKVLTLSISLPLRNQARLRALLANQYDPNSPLYHNFLTPNQFYQDYSPTDQTVSEVEDYLTASGLANPRVSPSHQFIDVQGKVSDIESAFHVQLHQYTYHGKTYYGPTSDPAVSSSLAGLVQNISGLDNFGVYQPAMKLRPHAQGSGYSASDIEKAYDTTGLGSSIDGSGQSIAFLELSDYQASDIQQYQQQNNLPSNTPQTVQVDGGAQLDDGTPEVELDLEVADAMAPKATQLVYEGPNSGQGINDVYSQIVNDDKAKIVSISWGLCEQQTGSAELQTLSQIFAQGAAEGIAFFAAAGDDGAYDCGDNNLAVDSPADDPNVTGVGGTTLTLNSGGSYGSEKAWSCTDSTCTSQAPNGSGGGGGVSQQFSLPKYQQGLNPSGASGTSNRFVPDVSADADPQTGYAIYCSAGSQDCTGNLVVGGTSAAAPAWAGSAALINQYLKSQNKSELGNANSTLYAVGDKSGAFHDVTSGDNLHYQAGPGYDLATGLGSPDVTKLAQAIANGNFGSGTGTGPSPTPTPGGSGNPTPTPNPGGGGTGGGELLTNNGFENGASPWGQSSSGGYDLIDTQNPHQGSYSADLCGYANCDDLIAQAFVVPQGATSLTVSYYWNMLTDKDPSVCNDHLTVSIYSVQDDGSGNLTLGNSITTIQNDCNQAANSNYAQKTKDISSILQSQAGQTVAIVFEGKTDGDSQNTTRYFVDDVSVHAG